MSAAFVLGTNQQNFVGVAPASQIGAWFVAGGDVGQVVEGEQPGVYRVSKKRVYVAG